MRKLLNVALQPVDERCKSATSTNEFFPSSTQTFGTFEKRDIESLELAKIDSGEYRLMVEVDELTIEGGRDATNGLTN